MNSEDRFWIAIWPGVGILLTCLILLFSFGFNTHYKIEADLAKAAFVSGMCQVQNQASTGYHYEKCK